MSKFTTILVANRGEIAVRVMKTAKALGYRTVAVYSGADVHSPHVKMADDAVCIGPAPVGESYLVIDKIIEAARVSGAGAIHPGYGFLSENAAFSKACEKSGLVFIGPTAKSIELMGNKAAAKRRMIKAGVPCIPGYEDADQADEVLINAAKKIGFPIMVKATAGGGGRGMRLVHKAEYLLDGMNSARSEALNAFGSDELILEKALIKPRHVEVQIFADTHGNTVHFAERDCSVQRRHQKVVEEAPCPVMTDPLRARMGAAAVDAAKSISYRGAGTVEFLLDTSGEFYFLEMNTRLQVEHPVTEMITGFDLVALQIKVAQGEPLGLTQDDVKLNGHAVEVRLYAEDPAMNFLPVTGRVDLWKPAVGEGVRIDAGIASGQEISPFYDPMVAKVIAWGETRDIAVSRLIGALKNTRLFGTKTNKSFLIDVLSNKNFQAGTATTAFIAEEFGDGGVVDKPLALTEAAIAAVLQYHTSRNYIHKAGLGINAELMNWNSAGYLETPFRYCSGDTRMDLTLRTTKPDTYEIICGDQNTSIDILDIEAGEATLSVNGRRKQAGFFVPEDGKIHLELEGRTFSLRNENAYASLSDEAGGGGRVLAPMHGVLLEVLVSKNDTVSKGDGLAVLESMKMQYKICAEVDGIVKFMHLTGGVQVAAGDLILEIDEEKK
ncbi:MAG: acetyl/propionyl/methylcrotonyl-CoA carboxylase subunit alpha [Xanthomonadales bacterium]|nr:acetyl/propionyl/methylcrotonyl-CoA carboxylase subunit alpha [Xanthomonadales bacterium]